MCSRDQDTHFMATGLDLTVMIDSIDLFSYGNSLTILFTQWETKLL